MDNTKDKWVEATGKLIQLTQDGKIRWVVDNPPRVLRGYPDEKVDQVFKTEYKGRNLRLYERLYKDPRMEPTSFWRIIGRKESPWQSQVVLEFVDERGQAFGFFPPLSILNDLLSSAKYQTSDIDTFLTELLKENTSNT